MLVFLLLVLLCVDAFLRIIVHNLMRQQQPDEKVNCDECCRCNRLGRALKNLTSKLCQRKCQRIQKKPRFRLEATLSKKKCRNFCRRAASGKKKAIHNFCKAEGKCNSQIFYNAVALQYCILPHSNIIHLPLSYNVNQCFRMTMEIQLLCLTTT